MFARDPSGKRGRIDTTREDGGRSIIATYLQVETASQRFPSILYVSERRATADVDQFPAVGVCWLAPEWFLGRIPTLL